MLRRPWFVFKFYIAFASHRDDEDFAEQQKKSLLRWAKKKGKRAVKTVPVEVNDRAKETSSVGRKNDEDDEMEAGKEKKMGKRRTANGSGEAKEAGTANTSGTANFGDTAKTSNESIRVNRPKETPPMTKFRDLDDDSDDCDAKTQFPHREPTDEDSEDQRPPKRGREESDNESIRSGVRRRRGPPGVFRRAAAPTGRLFDKPCSLCKKRDVDCEKDTFVAACVRCYIGKNRCDHGGRLLEAKRGRKYTGRKKVKKEKVEVESEDENTGDDKEKRQRPTKKFKSSEFIEDSDAEPLSGFETAQIPPASRSPSPKPRRKAAKKAMKAIAAAAATAQGSKMEGTSKMQGSSKAKRKFLENILFHC